MCIRDRDDVAQHGGAGLLIEVKFSIFTEREGEHIGRRVLLAVFRIELLDVCVVDE